MNAFPLAIATVLGAVVGSFLNVVILRLPEGASLVSPGSRCPACKAAIRWFDNFPVVSFMVLGGRCRSCRQPISWQYPLVEIVMAFLAFALYKRFFFSSAAFLSYFLFCAALLAVIVIDFRHQIIPDLISLPGIVIGFGLSFINPQIDWIASGIGLLCGGGIFYLIATGYYLVTKREGMGGGDIKLLAMIGAFLGWYALPFVIFFSSFLGLLAGIYAMFQQKKGGKTVIPYGPFLSLAAIFYLFFQEQIMQVWQSFLIPS